MKSTPTCPTSFCRKRYGLNTFLEYFLQKADMDLCVLTLDDLISIGTILAFDAIRKSTSQFHRDISADRMHPCLALLFHRDYFDRPDASLSDSFAPQGLLRPTGCISIGLFCSTGIISTDRMHLYRTLLLHRDYFTPVRCISIWLFCSTGITLPRSDASLSGSFVPQGLFRPAECISSLIFCSTGIISTDRIHPQLAFFFRREYFHWPDSSLASSFVPQGLLCPSQIHLYLALLFHRDYFDRLNSSHH